MRGLIYCLGFRVPETKRLNYCLGFRVPDGKRV